MRMKRFWPVLMVAVALITVSAACDDGNGDVTTGSRTDSYAELRDGEQYINRIQQGRDEQAQEQLLDRCRRVLLRSQDAQDPAAQQVSSFCDSIEDTDPNTLQAWDDIRRRLNELVQQAKR